ncbi:M20/M25/M40 family metallo-hydrolase [Roseicyclus mahoneyensis]|uniref:Acetylornithine deacetylase/succinyl-diaminopimelate desuccinylase-like protein n=1 Tax=Roseicyclus mahoneyensis TaxID=164332 RepID=A0A316GSC5_9RHOB|nr:M20/M25/M40 family metallo-hydrolase [Roseicyclus mahoneyensis]PWK62506.1 acetylornithine deacetylase/succinyl-diaminopimelate desuccinylase-like protein [Roseicyclus mahoneyensis]
MLDTPTNRDTAVTLARAIATDDAFRAALADLIAFPTDSKSAEAPLHAYLAHVAQGFAAMGFETQGYTSEGRPFLVASRVEDATRPTVLGYAHGDTVPGMEGRWAEGRDPWTLTEDPATGRWYGRGIADNKGQMLVNMTALQAVLTARGSLGFNIHVLVEMGEEIGSPGLAKVCERLKDRLKADLLLASDGPRIDAGTPTIFLGARGGATFRLTLKRRNGGRHSGNFGGALKNPAMELAHALASIATPTGALRVPGWVPEGVPEAARAALAGLTPAGGEVDADWGAEGLTPAERIHAWNSAEILAFSAGDISQPVNAIPDEAQAVVQLRYVPGIDDTKLEQALRAHLDAQGHGDITITRQGAEFRASATPVDHPAARFAAASIARTHGADPVVLPSLGGSLPNDIFTEILGIPTVWVPHSYPGCSQHAPDEHLPRDLFADATGLMAGLYWDLGAASKKALLGS